MWLIWSNVHKQWLRDSDDTYTGLRDEAGRFDFDFAHGLVSDENYWQDQDELPKLTMMPDNFGDI